MTALQCGALDTPTTSQSSAFKALRAAWTSHGSPWTILNSLAARSAICCFPKLSNIQAQRTGPPRVRVDSTKNRCDGSVSAIYRIIMLIRRVQAEIGPEQPDFGPVGPEKLVV